MASTHDAAGYWEVATDGGVFSFGDAPFHGSTGNIELNKPIVGMAVTPDGGGYWLVASDGGIFAFGTPASTGAQGTSSSTSRSSAWCPPTTGRATGSSPPTAASSPSATPVSSARWRVAPADPDRRRGAVARRGRVLVLGADGTRYVFGDVPAVGSPPTPRRRAAIKSPMTGLIPDFTGEGFDAVNGSGQAFATGDAPDFGDVTTAVPGHQAMRSASPPPRAERRPSASAGKPAQATERPQPTGVDAGFAASSRRRSPRLLP